MRAGRSGEVFGENKPGEKDAGAVDEQKVKEKVCQPGPIPCTVNPHHPGPLTVPTSMQLLNAKAMHPALGMDGC